TIQTTSNHTYRFRIARVYSTCEHGSARVVEHLWSLCVDMDGQLHSSMQGLRDSSHSQIY
ncbi:hypothetical protein B0O80DRAFT_460807, partial [Mortierella sp. GBAus27b]